MRPLLTFLTLFLMLGGVAGAEKKEFRDWLNSFGLSKPIVQDEVYYMGISYDGKKNLNYLLVKDCCYIKLEVIMSMEEKELIICVRKLP